MRLFKRSRKPKTNSSFINRLELNKTLEGRRQSDNFKAQGTDMGEYIKTVNEINIPREE